ncbi:MAG: alkyl sulfatase C-terminal domain-containing protein [Vicinamibacterales bacterium]
MVLRARPISPQVLHAMPIADVFDYLETRVSGPQAGTQRPLVINWTFADTRESLTSTLDHGALTSTTRKIVANAGATVTTTRPGFDEVILGQRTLVEALDGSRITTSGNVKAVGDLWAHWWISLPRVPSSRPGARRRATWTLGS